GRNAKPGDVGRVVTRVGAPEASGDRRAARIARLGIAVARLLALSQARGGRRAVGLGVVGAALGRAGGAGAVAVRRAVVGAGARRNAHLVGRAGVGRAAGLAHRRVAVGVLVAEPRAFLW